MDHIPCNVYARRWKYLSGRCGTSLATLEVSVSRNTVLTSAPSCQGTRPRAPLGRDRGAIKDGQPHRGHRIDGGSPERGGCPVHEHGDTDPKPAQAGARVLLYDFWSRIVRRCPSAPSSEYERGSVHHSSRRSNRQSAEQLPGRGGVSSLDDETFDIVDGVDGSCRGL